MILPIYVYGQPVLRKVAEDITPDYPGLKELIVNMHETMDHAEGVGLAAQKGVYQSPYSGSVGRRGIHGRRLLEPSGHS